MSEKIMAAKALGDSVPSDPVDKVRFYPFGDSYITTDPNLTFAKVRSMKLPKVVTFGKSRTDQLHNQSIAMMVRQGQGSVLEEELNNYDFDENRKDNGTLNVPTMFDSDWADPAQQFETSVSLNKEINAGISREVSEKRALADAAAKAKMAEAAAKHEVEKAAAVAAEKGGSDGRSKQ